MQAIGVELILVRLPGGTHWPVARTKDRVLRTLGRFGNIHRVGIAALTMVLALGAPARGSAEPRDPQMPGLQRLWREFPLDTSSGSTTPRGRSTRPPSAAASPAREAARPRANANISTERALPAGTTPAGGEDSPPTWMVVAFLAALLIPIALTALALRNVVIRRVRANARHQAFAAGTARASVTPGAEPHVDARDPTAVAVGPSDSGRKGRAQKSEASNESEIWKLKAKETRAPDSRKEVAALASEAEVIKSKPCVETEAEFLRRKSESQPSPPDELDRTETDLLKEKLAAGKAAPSPEAKPEVAIRGSHDRLRSKLRAGPDLEASEEPAAEERRSPTLRAPLRCEIRWPHGARSRFIAVVTQPRGRSREVASSPELGWHKSEPPPETGDTAEALRVLVSGLVRDGWTVEGRGDDWFSFQLSTATRERSEKSIARNRNRSSERRPS